MSDVTTFEGWAAVTPPNTRSGRRYIDPFSVAYTRKGAITMHCQDYPGDERGVWLKQRKRGWTVERVRIEVQS